MSGTVTTQAVAMPHCMIRASAGAGKTYRLTTHYLGLVLAGAEPPSILATTFTRKAAGQILGRILSRLAEAAMQREKAAQLARDLGVESLSMRRCRDMLVKLTGELHRVAVSTLDSFFARLARSFRLELGLPPAAQVVAAEAPAAADLRRRAIEALFAEEPPQVLLDLMQRLHHDSRQRRVTDAVEGTIAGLLDLHAEAPEAALWFADEIEGGMDEADLRAAIEFLRGQSLELTDKRFTKALNNHCQDADAGDWGSFCSKGLAKRIVEGATTFCNKEIPPPLIEQIERIIAHGRAEVLKLEQRRTHATFELLDRYVRHHERLSRRHRVMLFSDVPRALSTSLGRIDAMMLEDIYYRLDGRIGHLMLDEFQDTSLMQWQVLEPLAREIASHGDVDDRALGADRSFFCVGDVKQAIYGWRGGRAELFDHVERELGLYSQPLDESWRSSQIVLDAVNRVFGHLEGNPALEKHPEAVAAWNRDFRPHTAVKTDLPGYVELATSPAPPAGSADEATPDADADTTETDGAMDEDAWHLEHAATRIAELAGRMPGLTFGVLVPQNRDVSALIDLLRQRGVPASGEGGKPLTDDAAVLTMLCALRLADHPGDSIAAFRVLHSPLAAVLGMADMRPSTVRRVALAVREGLSLHGYAGLITAWARRIAADCDGRNVLRLTQLIELAEQWEALATPRPGQFVAFVEATAVEEPSAAPVRVMTIHKSKGLEFDVVVLPVLDKSIGSMHNVTFCPWRDEPTGPVRAVYPSSNAAVRSLFEPAARAHEQALARRVQDDLCGLYVAMTRARYGLYMLIRPLKQNDQGRTLSRGWRSAAYDTLLRHCLCELLDERFDGGEVLYAHGDAAWHEAVAGEPLPPPPPPPPPRVRRPRAAEAGGDARPATARRSWRQTSPSGLEGAGRVAVADLLRLTPAGGAEYGTVMHAFFQQVEWLDEQTEPPGEDELQQVAAAIAHERPEQEIERIITRFYELLSDPTVQQALAPPAQVPADQTLDLWREKPFAVRLDDDLVQGYFDRVVVRRRGGRAVGASILDFKTDSVSDDTVLEEKLGYYQPQIRAYRRCLATMLGLPPQQIEAALLFVALPRLVAVPFGG